MIWDFAPYHFTIQTILFTFWQFVEKFNELKEATLQGGTDKKGSGEGKTLPNGIQEKETNGSPRNHARVRKKKKTLWSQFSSEGNKYSILTPHPPNPLVSPNILDSRTFCSLAVASRVANINFIYIWEESDGTSFISSQRSNHSTVDIVDLLLLIPKAFSTWFYSSSMPRANHFLRNDPLCPSFGQMKIKPRSMYDSPSWQL